MRRLRAVRKPLRPAANTDLSGSRPIKEVQMTKQEIRNVRESLDVEMFKMNYKAGIRLPELEAFFAGDDNALDAKALERLDKMLTAEVRKNKKK